MAEPAYAVYWQPGCTSCLKAKEFLTRHAIGFESINVRESPAAIDRLAALGARSVPVVARGTDWVYAQDLNALAMFVGIREERRSLPVPLLVERLVSLLGATGRHVAQLPADVLDRTLPGRADRNAADLAWHVPMIVAGFLDAAGGGILTFEYFERRPQPEERAREVLVAAQSGAALALASWWQANALRLPQTVATYYGTQSLASVLERTAWHVAQHARQLESLVVLAGIEPDGPLSRAELDGLPLPEGVWDPEMRTPA